LSLPQTTETRGQYRLQKDDANIRGHLNWILSQIYVVVSILFSHLLSKKIFSHSAGTYFHVVYTRHLALKGLRLKVF